MYSREERMEVVQLYIATNFNVNAVFRTLGYPSPNALRSWYKEYEQTGTLKEYRKPVLTFSEEQKQAALTHYFENGRSVTATAQTNDTE